jgi:hypothetical protein
MYNTRGIKKYFQENIFFFTKFNQPEKFHQILCKKGLTYTKSMVSLYVETLEKEVFIWRNPPGKVIIGTLKNSFSLVENPLKPDFVCLNG